MQMTWAWLTRYLTVVNTVVPDDESAHRAPASAF
jgi:hypothetical protein